MPIQDRTLPLPATDVRLGRHVRHDAASAAYPVPVHVDYALPRERIDWARTGPVLDQGALSCGTACALLGLLMTEPHASMSAAGTSFGLASALELDGWQDPADTPGSSLAVLRAAHRRHLIGSYWWAFSPLQALAALRTGPLLLGLPWFESMMEPNKSNRVVVDQRSGQDGGHSVVADAWDPQRQQVRITNSWGESWGDAGRAWLGFGDLAWLLHQHGDAAQITLL